jgi:Phosphopantetheine attachment site.
MIPSYYTQLEKMPLNINGKVNKKLLPDPADGRKKTKAREPIDEIEILLLQILTDVLKRDNIGIDDNFFEIGGHSLNAVKTISQIQKKLGVDLALKEIFYNPVLADIASKVRKIMSDKNSTVLQNNEEKIIVPISDEELTLLSNLQFDDEE